MTDATARRVLLAMIPRDEFRLIDDGLLDGDEDYGFTAEEIAQGRKDRQDIVTRSCGLNREFRPMRALIVARTEFLGEITGP